MKKAKKFFLNLFILIIAGAAVFFIGWTNLYVKPGECAVMESKTGGLLGEPIQAGTFVWRWEKLLPTNVLMTKYNLESRSSSRNYSGSLPGATVYSTYVDPKPDFSYSAQIQVTIRLTPLGVWSLHKSGAISNQDTMNSYLDSKADAAGNKVMDWIIQRNSPLVFPAELDQDQIEKIFSDDRQDFKNLEILSVRINSAKIPDLQLYEIAKYSFTEYQKQLNETMQQKVQDQAQSILEESRTMDQLEKFAQLLKKYPELQEYTKNQDITVLMNAIRTLK